MKNIILSIAFGIILLIVMNMYVKQKKNIKKPTPLIYGLVFLFFSISLYLILQNTKTFDFEIMPSQKLVRNMNTGEPEF